jgi:hypothetical protein
MLGTTCRVDRRIQWSCTQKAYRGEREGVIDASTGTIT